MKLIKKKLLLTTAASIKGSSINTNSSLDKKENKLVEQFLTWNNQLCIAIFYTADKFCEFLWQRYISVYFFVFIWWPLLLQSCWSWKRFSSREQIDEVKSRGNFDYVFLGKFVPISSYTPAESKELYNEILLDALVYAFLVCLA